MIFLITLSFALSCCSPDGEIDIYEQNTQRNFYVDSNNGSDKNDGTSPQRAWRSLQKVNSQFFNPGDSCLFKSGGKWTGKLVPIGSGKEKMPIYLGSYDQGEKPILENIDDDETVLIKNIRNIILEGFDISNRSSLGIPFQFARGIHINATIQGNFENIIIRNNDVHDVEGLENTQRWRSGAIFIQSEVEGAHFDNILIEGNKINNCTVRGIHAADGKNTSQFLHKNLVVRNNSIDNIALDGIRIMRAENVLIEHNRVFRCGNYFKAEKPLVLAACWTQRSKNSIIQYNEIAYTSLTFPEAYEMMDSQSFDIDFDSPGYTVIQYNYSHDNTGGFFLSMGDPGLEFEYGIIRYNISQNDGNKFNGRLFELHNHAGGRIIPLYIYNNTFYSDSRIWIQDRGNGSGRHNGIKFTNNIFYAPNGIYDDPQNIEYNNNLYYNHSVLSADKNYIQGNPLFLFPGEANMGIETASAYKIQKNSSAIKKGLAIGNNGGLDFFGNPVQTNYPDVGAHQFSID